MSEGKRQHYSPSTSWKRRWGGFTCSPTKNLLVLNMILSRVKEHIFSSASKLIHKRLFSFWSIYHSHCMCQIFRNDCGRTHNVTFWKELLLLFTSSYRYCCFSNTNTLYCTLLLFLLLPGAQKNTGKFCLVPPACLFWYCWFQGQKLIILYAVT